MSNALLQELNEQMVAVHRTYEDFFWTSYMGDHSVDKDMIAAQGEVDAFRSNRELSARVDTALETAKSSLREKLLQWQKFFSCYQTPQKLLKLRTRISEIEASIRVAQASRKEGYINPDTGSFVKASLTQMNMMMNVYEDEAVRKACFEALEELAKQNVAELIKLVQLRNEFAHTLGDEDFYAYKLRVGEGMTKTELFALWDEIYKKTKFGFENVREMERERPGIRLPWNNAFMFEGNLQKKKDPFLQFSDALERWGHSFAALGIDYQGAVLQLDLLDRKGKYRNGFCHWPGLVHFKDGERVSGKCNFTSTSILGQIGAGEKATGTLFHEGGHAAHLTNVETTEVCMNHEYPPCTAAWAETQSMFLDTMQESAEWLTRYAKDASGEAYPIDLFEKEVREHHPIAPLDFMFLLMIPNFERELYSTPNLTEEKVLAMARKVHQKHTDLEIGSLFILTKVHLYSWPSACCYHGYGLATLALSQWREYFYKKYGYIVDNPEVGREMREVWKLGASKTFAELVKLATGKKLSADAYITSITQSIDEKCWLASEHIQRLASVPEHTGPVDLNATIRMVDGKDVIADNKEGFEEMAKIYRQWVLSKEIDSVA